MGQISVIEPGQRSFASTEKGGSDALGYNSVGKGPVRGVTLYNPDLMLGGVITWLGIADLFRPRVQSSLF
jgi:hypothetical protein